MGHLRNSTQQFRLDSNRKIPVQDRSDRQWYRDNFQPLNTAYKLIFLSVVPLTRPRPDFDKHLSLLNTWQLVGTVSFSVARPVSANGFTAALIWRVSFATNCRLHYQLQLGCLIDPSKTAHLKEWL
jgi:hypothetical protein